MDQILPPSSTAWCLTLKSNPTEGYGIMNFEEDLSTQHVLIMGVGLSQKFGTDFSLFFLHNEGGLDDN